MTTIYLMRHGQTRFNAQQRIQGACDSPLTALGISQAEQAAQYFKAQGIHFDAIYSSTQERACDTAEIVGGTTAVRRLKDLRECDFGEFEAYPERLNPPIIPNIGYGDYFVAYGGEGYETIRERMQRGLATIASEHPEGTCLVVSHGGVITQFLIGVLDEHPRVRYGNCVTCQLARVHDRWELLKVINPVDGDILYDRDAS